MRTLRLTVALLGIALFAPAVSLAGTTVIVIPAVEFAYGLDYPIDLGGPVASIDAMTVSYAGTYDTITVVCDGPGGTSTFETGWGLRLTFPETGVTAWVGDTPGLFTAPQPVVPATGDWSFLHDGATTVNLWRVLESDGGGFPRCYSLGGPTIESVTLTITSTVVVAGDSGSWTGIKELYR